MIGYGPDLESLLKQTALLTRKDANIPREDLDRLARLIEKAKQEGR